MNDRSPRARILTLAAVVVVGVFVVVGAFSLKDTLVPLGERLIAAVLPGTLFALANQDRAAAGASTLTYNPLLEQAAKLKAEDMATKGYFAHVTPTGETPLYFLNQVGYRYKNVGENLGLNYNDAQSVETAWLNSPKHKEALLYTQFTEVGIGVSSGTYQGMPATFVVALFATPLPPLVTPKPAVPVVPAASSTNAARVRELNAAITTLQKQIAELSAELQKIQ